MHDRVDARSEVAQLLRVLQDVASSCNYLDLRRCVQERAKVPGQKAVCPCNADSSQKVVTACGVGYFLRFAASITLISGSVRSNPSTSDTSRRRELCEVQSS